MDTITTQEEQSLLTAGKYKSQKKLFLKRTLQLIVSVALFSLFLCYSAGFPFFPHSFNVYFSTLLFSFFTHTLERKYMFLLCNGILVLLAKTSFSGDSPPEACVRKQDLTVVVEDDAKVAAEETNPGGDQKLIEKPVCREVVEEGESDVYVVAEAVNQDEGSGMVADEEEVEGDAAAAGKEVTGAEEEVVEGDAAAAGEEVASTEELNRKIEDFIRKMKEEIRIEAQQQLIEAV